MNANAAKAVIAVAGLIAAVVLIMTGSPWWAFFILISVL